MSHILLDNRYINSNPYNQGYQQRYTQGVRNAWTEIKENENVEDITIYIDRYSCYSRFDMFDGPSNKYMGTQCSCEWFIWYLYRCSYCYNWVYRIHNVLWEVK